MRQARRPEPSPEKWSEIHLDFPRFLGFAALFVYFQA